jgi:hypothetical protein
MPKTFTFRKSSKDPNVISIVSLGFALRIPDKKIMENLESDGYSLSKPTLYKLKAYLRQNLAQDINEAFAYGIIQEYFAAIKAIKEGQRRLWELSDEETDPLKKGELITQAINTYPFLTGYYNNLQKVISRHKAFKIQPDITV